MCSCDCGGFARRIWGPVNIRLSLRAHWNNTVGQYVSNDREFRDALKRGSEEASVRTGIDHNFQPVDGREKEALGVTDHGLEEQERKHRELGAPWAQPKRSYH